MILSSDDQNALDVMSSALREHEPRLAAKFGIFTRLAEGEGRPPDEDLISPAAAARRAGPAPVAPRAWPGAAWSARRRGRREWGQLGRSRLIVLVPVALLMLLILIITMTIATGVKCATTAPRHGLAVTGHPAAPVCRQAGTAKASGHRR
jgi:hypothetical protein